MDAKILDHEHPWLASVLPPEGLSEEDHEAGRRALDGFPFTMACHTEDEAKQKVEWMKTMLARRAPHVEWAVGWAGPEVHHGTRIDGSLLTVHRYDPESGTWSDQ